ncbi:MAG TPA: Rid family detoxifying hydrolase [Ferruginibacter sp.]|nr:Rid family detoxifying hydrolase [Ferruginibacter sp.]
MTKEIINTPNAPAPIGPYNQAVRVGNLLFISGQVAFKPGTSDLVIDDIASETHQVMKNLEAILSAASMHFKHVVKTTIFLSDMSLFTQVNEVYAKYFESTAETGQVDYPARETVAVKGLPKGVNVEISMIASAH